MIQAAIIGVTGYGQIHFEALQALREQGRVNIVAATIINEEEAREATDYLKQAGTRIYRDYQAMLQTEHGKIDLCCIPTGIAWHCPMTLAALEAGAHVYMEKPVAATVNEVDRMIAARDQAGKHVIVGYQDMAPGPIQHMKRRILAGDIGQPQTVRLMACWPRGDAYYTRNNWAGRLKAGDAWVYDSPANNALAHYVIAALYFTAPELDAVDRVESGIAELYRAKAIETFDTLSVRAQTARGVETLITLTHSCECASSPVIEVRGTEGSIRWDFNEQIVHQPSGESLKTPAGAELSRVLIKRYVEALEQGKSVGCSLEMAREHTRLINALHEQCPIHNIGKQHCGEGEWQGSRLDFVCGMNEAVQRSFDEGKLFSELGLGWAQPPTPFHI